MLKWAWRIGTVAGIAVYLHGTFLLLIGFVLLSEWQASRSLPAAIGGVLFVLAIFLSVVLHEFGHALTARRFGIRTRDITLLPIGGIARLERMPDEPRQELWVALAGPAVNVVLAGLTFAGLQAAGIEATAVFDSESDQALPRFMMVNLGLAAFNMLPAFPMDGGRVLRAVLAERLDYVRATEIAATLGQGLALLLGFVGLFSNPFLVFIALFVWMGASSEVSTVGLRAAMAGLPVGRAMITDFRALEVGQTLQDAVQLVLTTAQRDFPVLHEGRLVGLLTRDTLMGALAERGPGAEVSSVMAREFETADAREMLETAFARLQRCACPVLPILKDGAIVGLLTPENVGELVMIRGAMGGRGG
jgi:Zn-dependent protease/CBS domain-containing protein